MPISLEFWEWGCPKCGDAHAYHCDSGTSVEFEEWRERCSQIQVTSILSQRSQRREVGLQLLLKQRTQPRPQGPLVFPYDGGKVPPIGKREDLRDEADGNHQLRRSLELFFSDRSDHMEIGL